MMKNVTFGLKVQFPNSSSPVPIFKPLLGPAISMSGQIARFPAAPISSLPYERAGRAGLRSDTSFHEPRVESI